MDNATWARSLINELIHQGIRDFCVAPGSRSTPLVQALFDHPLAQTHVHFDERGLGFLALGIAEAKRIPVAIIVTSGTAVGNLMPAVIEAKHSFSPLIVLSADRPPELRDMGANQTIDQVKIFGSFVKWQFDLPCPSQHLKADFVRRIAAYAVNKAAMGPVHINCMFREPLTSTGKGNGTAPISKYFRAVQTLNRESLLEIADLFAGIKKGIIIAGRMPEFIDKEPITLLSERLGWPIFADVLSNMRNTPRVVPYFGHQECQPEAILHFGDRLVEKKRMQAPIYMHVCGAEHCTDAHGFVTHKVSVAPDLFAKALLPHLPLSTNHDHFLLWEEESSHRKQALDAYFKRNQSLTEQSLIYHLSQHVDELTAFYIGNSMPIRDANLLFYPKKCGPIFANRGASGIDGNLATAIGICRALKMHTIALVGDLTALHDLNSLAMVKNEPLTIFVINNGGGGIFSFLPVASNSDSFRKFFATEHSFSLRPFAEAFGLNHTELDFDSLAEIPLIIKEKKPTLVEIKSDRETNVFAHQELYQAVFHRRGKLGKSTPSFAARLYGAKL